MDSLVFSLNATVPIFTIIFISYFLRQKGFFTDAFVSGADRFTFRILLPLLLFQDIARGDIQKLFEPRFFFFCFGITVLTIAIIWICAHLFLDRSIISAFVQASYRSSVAILGVAFAENIYGSAGYVPLMIVAIVPLYNIVAVTVLTVYSAEPLPGKSLARTCLKGILTNPIILGIFLALPFSLLQIQFPMMVTKTIAIFADMASPLALVVIGAGFEGGKALSRLKVATVASFIKLVALPAIFLPISYWIGFRGEALVALAIMLGSPTTVTSYIMAKNMGGDATLSANAVVITTAASALTLTVIIFVLRYCGAI